MSLVDGKPLSEHTRKRILDSGDTSLWAPLIQWYRQRVVRYVESLGADHHLAEDVAQNTFIKAVQKFDRFQRDCNSFAPWLFAIARNELRSAQRGKQTLEQGTGTTTWMQRQQELEADDVQLTDLTPTIEDRQRALAAAIANPAFPTSEELVSKELFHQLDYLLNTIEREQLQPLLESLFERLDQVVDARYREADGVRRGCPQRNWRIYLLRQVLRAPAKLTARLLDIPYSANIHKIGYRIEARLKEFHE